MCQEVYLLGDQCNVHPDNVKLFVNFDEVISSNKPCDITIDHDNNSLELAFTLDDKYKNIGEYLHAMCFCHTNNRPLIEFKHMNDKWILYKHDAMHTDIRFTEEFVIIKIPFYSTLDVTTLEYGGMYKPSKYLSEADKYRR